MDDELRASEIGDEDFFEQAEAWKPDSRASARKIAEVSMEKVARSRTKPAASTSKAAPSKVAKATSTKAKAVPKKTGRASATTKKRVRAKST